MAIREGHESKICNEFNLSRLDGKYEACPWPSEDQKLLPLVDAGDGCSQIDRNKFAGKNVFPFDFTLASIFHLFFSQTVEAVLSPEVQAKPSW